MFGFMKKVAPILFVLAVALTNSAFSNINFGGEIPWPLSIQHAVTVQNSKGLWRLKSGQDTRVFNVEMRKDSRSGFDWIRVSEFNPETYEVISWGEGFFSPNKPVTQPESSFSNVGIETSAGKVDSLGRYIHMFANGDLNSHPYLLRMVEVETQLGNVLGISVIDYTGKKYKHMLGTRVFKEPFGCFETKDDKEELKCYYGYE